MKLGEIEWPKFNGYRAWDQKWIEVVITVKQLDMVYDIVDWCNEYYENDWMGKPNPYHRPYSKNKKQYRFHFKDEDAAMAFKLRWT